MQIHPTRALHISHLDGAVCGARDAYLTRMIVMWSTPRLSHPDDAVCGVPGAYLTLMMLYAYLLYFPYKVVICWFQDFDGLHHKTSELDCHSSQGNKAHRFAFFMLFCISSFNISIVYPAKKASWVSFQ